ncbi:MAG: hypothetical protein V4558_14585 [Gemmatimonadota bacterium]
MISRLAFALAILTYPLPSQAPSPGAVMRTLVGKWSLDPTRGDRPFVQAFSACGSIVKRDRIAPEYALADSLSRARLIASGRTVTMATIAKHPTGNALPAEFEVMTRDGRPDSSLTITGDSGFVTITGSETATLDGVIDGRWHSGVLAAGGIIEFMAKWGRNSLQVERGLPECPTTIRRELRRSRDGKSLEVRISIENPPRGIRNVSRTVYYTPWGDPARS